jgi:monoamine oxidase
LNERRHSIARGKTRGKLDFKNTFLNSFLGNVKLEKARYTINPDSITVSARHHVVAMSPLLASRITLDPPLPTGQDQHHQRMRIGAIE